MNKIIVLTLFIFAVITVNAQQERKFIRQGNREYEKAVIDSVTTDTTRYQNAEVDYRKAIEKDPNNWDASYNLANSLYRQSKFDESTKQFQAVAGVNNENKEDLAKAFHNLGNSYLQSNKLSEAVEAYKNSLRNNPNDYETKYNLAWAQNKMHQQQDQQQDQDQNKDQEDQDKQDQEQQNKDQQDQDKQNQDQEQQDKQNQQQDQKEQQQQSQEQEQQENQISKEDAMRILEALQNDEKQVQEKVQKQKAQPKKRNTQKDW